MPREMVLRLNGGGGTTAPGAVDVPVVVVVGAVVIGGVPVVGVVAGVVGAAVVVLLGETPGENTVPTAYDVRSIPYVFARCRSTSRISMSNTISARGLSF